MDRKAIMGAVEKIRATSEVDILFNNAGIIRRGPAQAFTDEDWDDVLDVNLTAPFLLARELGADMVSRGSGKIIFTASLLSFQGGLTVPSYAASKGGVLLLMRALANEWASNGVNVNAVAPGYIKTDVNVALREDPERYLSITSRIPAGHWGEPDDIAASVVFLASEAAKYVHGEVVTVDGGWMGR
jgi:2-deoxy-D-gluconate 3-dehydrogenase